MCDDVYINQTDAYLQMRHRKRRKKQREWKRNILRMLLICWEKWEQRNMSIFINQKHLWAINKRNSRVFLFDVVMMLWHSSPNHMLEKCNKMHYNGNVPCVICCCFCCLYCLSHLAFDSFQWQNESWIHTFHRNRTYGYGRVLETYKRRWILSKYTSKCWCRAKVWSKKKANVYVGNESKPVPVRQYDFGLNFDKSLLQKNDMAVITITWIFSLWYTFRYEAWNMSWQSMTHICIVWQQ